MTAYLPRLGHHSSCLDEQLQLVVGVVSAGVSDVVENLLAVHPVALGDGKESNRSEGSFSVDIQALALATSHFYR
jgi:hypothetical protein